MLHNISINTLLNRITPKTGINFTGKSQNGDGTHIAPTFPAGNIPAKFKEQVNHWQKKITRIDDSFLGQYSFMPVSINGYDLPIPIIKLDGEKKIIETDLWEVGTVFEKVADPSYDISILIQLIGKNRLYPKEQFKEVTDIWHGSDLVHLDCALTDYFLPPPIGIDTAEHLNFLIEKIAILDNEGSESTEFIQIDGRSNTEFFLELID